jgi:hypothetical protein
MNIFSFRQSIQNRQELKPNNAKSIDKISLNKKIDSLLHLLGNAAPGGAVTVTENCKSDRNIVLRKVQNNLATEVEIDLS